MKPVTPIQYILNNVAPELASDYLSRVYNLQGKVTGYQPLTLIVSYLGQEVPREYYMLAERFPHHCTISRKVPGSPILIYGTLFQLAELINFSSQISETLYSQLFKELKATSSSPGLKIKDETWYSTTPKVMAILNATPDSFYDGGTHFERKDYGDIAAKMISDGADIIDIGGESTRPGSLPVSEEEEIRRILPAVEQIRSRFSIPLSVDTVKPNVADLVLSKGTNLINDISGLSAGKEMIDTIVKHKASYCLMHTQGASLTMQKNPTYSDVVSEIYAFFKEKISLCETHGLTREHLTLDPGIGFGKTVEHNLDLLRFLEAFQNLNCLVLLGTSNKSSIGKVINREGKDRLPGTITTQVMGWMKQASIFRVHEVQENADALKMARIYTQATPPLSL